MGRLTPQVIEKAPQFTNTLRDRELDLRGNTIDLIENLGVTKDVFDTIDLSDNRIKRIEGIPLLNRLTTLVLNNNHINYISEDLHASLPNIESLVLSKNYVQDYKFIDALQGFKTLYRLSLINNPITTKQNYRNYVIYKLPTLKVLDFNKIKAIDRKTADIWADSEEGSAFLKRLIEDPAFSNNLSTLTPAPTLTDEAKDKIKIAIQDASTLDEISRLKIMLQSEISHTDNLEPME